MRYVKTLPPIGRQRANLQPFLAKLRRDTWAEFTPNEIKALTGVSAESVAHHVAANEHQSVVMKWRHVNTKHERVYARLY